MPRQRLTTETAFLTIDGTIKLGACRRNVRAWLRHFGSGAFADDLRAAISELRAQVESQRSALAADRSDWATIIPAPGEYADSFEARAV